MAGNDVVLYQPKGLAVIERMVRRRLWERLRSLAASLPFLEAVLAAYFCALDPRTPFSVKAALLGALAGLLVPQRLIPNVIKSLVLTGDVGFMLGALQALAGHIRPEHRIRARLALIRLRQERNPA